MRNAKSVLTVMIVLMVLSLTFTSVGAQDEVPVDLSADWTDQPDQAMIPDGTLDGDAMIGVDGPVYPISPYISIVYSRTPVFYFHRDYRAAKYLIEVRMYEGASLYSFRGVGTCNAFSCWLQPTTKLKSKGIDSPGHYEWRVASVDSGGVVQPFSIYADFFVFSKGFNSSFDTNYNKWHNGYGPWYWLDEKGQLMTLGDAGKYNNMYHTEYFQSFDYTVRMKRKVNAANTNAVVVWGDPTSATTDHNWSDGIYIFYTNSGDFGVMKFVSGEDPEMLALIFDCPLVKPYSWNEIRVVGVAPYLDIWLNGYYLGWVGSNPPGYYLGIDMFSTGASDEKFLVDWAKVSAVSITDSLTHDPSMQLGVAPGAADPNSQ